MVNTSAQVSLSTGVADVLRTVEKVGKSKRSAHTSAIDVKKLKMVLKSRVFSSTITIWTFVDRVRQWAGRGRGESWREVRGLDVRTILGNLSACILEKEQATNSKPVIHSSLKNRIHSTLKDIFFNIPCSARSWFFASFICTFSAGEAGSITGYILTLAAEILKRDNGEKTYHCKEPKVTIETDKRKIQSYI